MVAAVPYPFAYQHMTARTEDIAVRNNQVNRYERSGINPATKYEYIQYPKSEPAKKQGALIAARSGVLLKTDIIIAINAHIAIRPKKLVISKSLTIFGMAFEGVQSRNFENIPRAKPKRAHNKEKVTFFVNELPLCGVRILFRVFI